MNDGLDERFEAVHTRVGTRQSLARDENEQTRATRPSSVFAQYSCECAA
jgi:hypothetical protein